MAYGAAGTPITGSPPSCRVYNSAAISITTSGAWQTVTFNSERHDTDNMHSTVSNTSRITFNTPGVYLVTGCIEFAANAVGIRGIQLILNGTALSIAGTYFPTTGGVVGTGVSVTTLYKFATNDYVECQAYQTSGGALNVNATGNFTPEFSAMWLGLGT